jgi:hypothetical protein
MEAAEAQALRDELRALALEHEQTAHIEDFLVCRERFPLDVRHNAKILRGLLAQFAEAELKGR